MQPIWTIGHSTRKIDIFISLLEENGIKLLVDVRTLPGSKRYPQFNKEKLAKSLQEHGIRYEHFAELGGRRKPRPNSRNIAWRNTSFRGYADYMETEEFGKGIKRLVDLANESGPTVIMCGVQCKPAPAARASRVPSFAQPTSETTRRMSLGLACDAIPRNKPEASSRKERWDR